MGSLLTSILPVFLLVALGYAAVRFRVFPAAGLAALGSFVIRIALPVLLFHSLTQHPLREVFNGRYLAAYALGSLLAMAVGLLWSRQWRRQSLERAAIVAMGCSYANSAYLAYPIVLQLLGPVAGRVLALCSLVENILMMPLTLAIADSASATHEPFVRALGRSLARLRHNPIIIGIVLGAACASLRLPEALERAVELVAACSAPLALFTVGGNLVGLALGELLLDAQAISFTKLLLHPLAVAALMLTIGPADPALRMGAVITASAPMLTIYPIFGARHGLQGLCAAALLLATTLSFVTLSTWVWLISAGGPLSALFH